MKCQWLLVFQAKHTYCFPCRACKDQWVFNQRTLLDGIDKVLGPTALLQLKTAGIDIGNYALEIPSPQKWVNPL